MNHGNDKIRIQKPKIPRGKDVCMAKSIRFLSRNQQVLSSSLIITIGKRSAVKDMNKLKIHKVFSKKKSL